MKTHPRGRIARLGIALMLTVSSLVTAAIVVELTARFVVSRRKVEWGWLHYDYSRGARPYTMFGPPPGQYRGRVCTASNKAPGEFRVVVLGGSTVVIGTPSLPDAIESRLKAEGWSAAAVCNFGVISQNSSQELIRLLTEAGDVKPDLVLFYDGANDLMDEFFWDPRPGYPYNYLSLENNPLFNPSLDVYPWLGVIGMGSAAVRWLAPGFLMRTFYPLDRLRRNAGYGSAGWRDQIAEIYLRNLSKARFYVRPVPFLAVFQPLLYFKDRLSDEESQLGANVGDARAHARLTRDRVRVRLEQEPPDFRAAFVDASDLFKDNPKRVFRDYVHFWDDRINNEIAARIIDELKSRKLLPQRKG